MLTQRSKLPARLPNGDRACEEVRFQPDWQSYPAVIIESDDWGACERAPTRAAWRQLKKRRLLGSGPFDDGTLESAADIRWLENLLGAWCDAEGLPAVLTAFSCVANPDYRAIAAAGFQRYCDRGIGCGLPSGWRRPGLGDAWTAAMRAGTFHPEFHTRLHHTHAGAWLERLRAADARARRLFEQHIYFQGKHLPEYQDMDPRAQHEWIAGGVGYFREWTGRPPTAAVTSDATPVTEILWRANGIRTSCLRNFRNARGEVVVYPNKPWNNQSPYTPMGGWNPVSDMVYLRRNVDFECAWKVGDIGRVVDLIRRQWDTNEPAVLNCHRVNFVCFDGAKQSRGRDNLQALLEALDRIGGVRFLSSPEVGDLYRNGWSARLFGDTLILRARTRAEGVMALPRRPKRPNKRSVPRCTWKPDPAGWRFTCEPGDHIFTLRPSGPSRSRSR